MTETRTSRRMLIAGAASIAAAVPALAAGGSAVTGATPVAALWAKAEALRLKLESHRAEIASLASRGGAPGWMYLGGEANKLGQARYETLVQIIKAEPKSASDLAVMAKVALDPDIQQGPRGWAYERLAQATLALHG